MLLTVAWTFTLAPLEGPDEPSHFDYTQYLAETGHKPSPVAGTHPDSTQAATAIYFFNLDQLAGVTTARPAWTRLEERYFDYAETTMGPNAEKDGSGPNSLGQNPPLYYAYEVVPYYLGSLGSFWDRLIVMRLASGLLYLAVVVLAWLAACEVFARTWPRVLATGCVALLPQLTAMSGTINADNLLIAVWSAFTLLALRLVRRGPSALRILVLCLLAGASLLTHGRGIAIVPALLVVVAIAVLRARPSLKQAAGWLAPGAALVTAAAAGYAVLLAPSNGAYGGEFTLTHGGALTIKGFLNATWQFYLPRLPFMGNRTGPPYGYRQMFIESFFGRFGSLEVGFSPLVYLLIQLAAAAGLVGLVLVVVGRWHAIRPRWPEMAVAAAISVSMIGLLHLASYRSLVGQGGPLITGRYLLPLVIVFGLTVAFVLGSLPARASALCGTVVLSGLLALNLAGLMLTFTRFYA